MTTTPSASIYRVTVKGKFADLTERALTQLKAATHEHTYFKSGYTPEGTFVYDADVAFFSLRYEVRLDGDCDADPADIGQLEAETFLETLGYGYTKLRVDVVDMASMWRATE